MGEKGKRGGREGEDERRGREERKEEEGRGETLSALTMNNGAINRSRDKPNKEVMTITYQGCGSGRWCRVLRLWSLESGGVAVRTRGSTVVGTAAFICAVGGATKNQQGKN